MQFILAVAAFLPAFSAASCIAERAEGGLPTVDILNLPSNSYALANAEAEAVAVAADNDLTTRQTCSVNYPWYCLGRCCRYSRCCRNSCCGPDVDFCGSDGHCYIYV
jgi:hypothetical protein